MEKRTLTKSALLLSAACLLALPGDGLILAGQNKAEAGQSAGARSPQQKVQNDETRRLWDEGLLKMRRARRKKLARRNYIYNRVTPAVAEATTPSARTPARRRASARRAASPTGQVVGVTFWRLRPAASGDEARLLVQDEGGQATELTPERVAAETPLKEGDFVRVSIESPRSGYLYVINREQHSDGSLGEPYLIFPTLRTHGGHNRVEAGRIVEIPAQEDNPPYFTMRLSSSEQAAEVLTVLITREPLETPALQRGPIKLSAEKVAEWEQAWKAPVERIEQVGGQGTAWTTAEKEAGREETRRLTQDEPLPQTIYHVITRPGHPIFVNVSLVYGNK